MSIDERDRPLTDAAPEPVSRPARGWAALKPLLLRLHFYAGVLVAPFVAVAALTGILYIYTPQLEQALYDHELHVPAAEGHVPLDEQVEIAEARVPDGELSGVRPGHADTDSTQVVFTRPDLEPSWYYTVFVDPHDGEVRGEMKTYGSSQALPVRGWIDNLHRGLHLGDVGRLYSELAASWLWVVVLAGLALWIGRRRRQNRARRLLLPAGGPAGRRRLLSWHGTVGLWGAVGFLFLSATGLSWSLHAGANITELRDTLDWTTPTVAPEVHHAAGADAGTAGHHEGAGTDIGLEGAHEAAVAAGLSGPVEVRRPAEPGQGYVVQEVGRTWPIEKDALVVDPASGEITDTLRFADFPLAAKLTEWGIAAHMGLLFGLPNQIALTVLALGLVCLAVWGYRMWWRRRPTRGDAWVGRPPARGAWRRAPAAVLAPVVAVAALVGYFLPVMGVSLLAFLVLDVLVGVRARRKAGDSPGAAGLRGELPDDRDDRDDPDELDADDRSPEHV